MTKFLVRHLGNMGDHVFLVPPALRALKQKHPDCHITLVVAWGYKQKKGLPLPHRAADGSPTFSRKQVWGDRNQAGFCIALMMTDPHVDQLVHYHDTEVALDGSLCQEDEQSFPTWSAKYYEEQKVSGDYDAVFELDFGLTPDDNPIERVAEVLGMPGEVTGDYELYLTDEDKRIALEVMRNEPRPRIVLLEALSGEPTRNWDPSKAKELEERITKAYSVAPRWFGAKHIPAYEGKTLTLRQNIATLQLCDVAVGVLSGPLHFAAAVGLPTLTLYNDHAIHRTAPAYFINPSIQNPRKHHRTLLGPFPAKMEILKRPTAPAELTPAEVKQQHYSSWNNPGKQDTKSGLGVITVDEVMQLLKEMVPN